MRRMRRVLTIGLLAALAATGAGGCAILGAPTTAAPPADPTAFNQANSLAAGNLDGDGRPDAVAAVQGSAGKSIQIYGGLPGGSFTKTGALLGKAADTARLADMDADNRDDVVACCNESGFYVVRIYRKLAGGPVDDTTMTFGIPTSGCCTDIEVGDFVRNRPQGCGGPLGPACPDGPDVAVLYADGTVRVYSNVLNGQPPSLAATVPPPTPPSGRTWRPVGFADGASSSDLSEIAYAANDSAGENPTLVAIPPFDTGGTTAAAKFPITGARSALAAGSGAVIRHGTTPCYTFLGATICDGVPRPSTFRTTLWAVSTVADDGKLAVSAFVPRDYPLLGWQTTPVPNQGADATLGAPLLADLDGDDSDDVVVYSKRSGTGQDLLAMTGKLDANGNGGTAFCGGNGTFGVNTSLPDPLQTGARRVIADAGDLTGDGKRDVVAGPTVAAGSGAPLYRLANASVAGCPG